MFETFFNDLFEDFEKSMRSFEANTKKFQKKMEEAMKDTLDMPTMFGTPSNYKKDTGEDANSTWTHETWTDRSGLFKYSRKVIKSKQGQKTTKENEVKTPTLDELRAKMEEHAKNHEYEKAAEIRDIIKQMEKEA